MPTRTTGQFALTGNEVAVHLKQSLTTSYLKKKATGHRLAPAKKAKRAKANRPVKRAKKARRAIPPAAPPGFFARVKREFDLLVCTNDAHYKSLRQRLISTRTQTSIVSVLAAFITHQFGVTVGVATPVVSAVLLMFLQLGRNAYCSLG